MKVQFSPQNNHCNWQEKLVRLSKCLQGGISPNVRMSEVTLKKTIMNDQYDISFFTFRSEYYCVDAIEGFCVIRKNDVKYILNVIGERENVRFFTYCPSLHCNQYLTMFSQSLQKVGTSRVVQIVCNGILYISRHYQHITNK